MIRNPLVNSAVPLLALVFCLTHNARADQQTSEHTLIGLFSPDREKDFREVMSDLPELELVHLDYDNAKVTFRYDLRALFPELNAKKPPTPGEIEQHISNLLREASNTTFTLKLTPTAPKEKLTKLEFKIGILDCKGCRYAAYLAATKVKGVEQATVTTDNIVTTWIDPTQTDAQAIEAALKKARIEHVSKQ
jgi:hypothetical protein